MAFVGLSDFHAAVYNEELETYGVPVKLSPAVSANITPSFNVAKMYGDDRAVYIEETLGDITFEFALTDLQTSEYELLLGKQKDLDGVIIDSVEDRAPFVAIMFRMALAGGGYKYYCYYKGKFQIPSTSGTTKGDTTEFAPETLSGLFIAREDGKWRAHADSNTSTGATNSWFTGVYETI